MRAVLMETIYMSTYRMNLKKNLKKKTGGNVRFLNKNKYIWLLLIAFIAKYPLHASAPSDLKINDGYYADYPATKPADAQKTAQIKRGEYLAKMGDCMACHTNSSEGGE